jgi:hypothetical protein
LSSTIQNGGTPDERDRRHDEREMMKEAFGHRRQSFFLDRAASERSTSTEGRVKTMTPLKLLA